MTLPLGDRHMHLTLDLVLGHCTDRPASWAVSSEAGHLTYLQLDAASSTVANAISATGDTGERVIAIALPPGPTFVAAALGVMRAGASYLPIDLAEPLGRCRRIFDAARPLLTITSNDARKAVPFADPLYILDTPARDIERRNAEPPLHPDALAYVIFTSGSSGIPKGVAVPHRGLANLVRWHIVAHDVDQHSRVMQFASLGFDASVWETWATLAAGAHLIVPPPYVRANPPALRDWIVAQAITHAFVPTAVAESLMQLDWPVASSLRVLLTGGDVLRRRPPHGLRFKVVNHYGPTETSVVATAADVLPEHADELPAIGRPVECVEVFLVDSDMNPVVGAGLGEIVIGGAGVARGYYRDPAQTALRFVPDPRPDRSGVRLYRTGDLGHRNPCGSLQFDGRLDRQVKIRGFRVEPAEVEQALLQHPDVREAAVTTAMDSAGEVILVAHVVTQRADDAETVRAWEHLFDDVYAESAEGATNALDVVGWASSRTGEAIPLPEMREWHAATVQRIRRLNPSRVVEIGCGTGMLVRALAPTCAEYWATDASIGALNRLRPRVSDLPQVREVHCRADAVDLPVTADLVLLNSVIQYFPSEAYLDRVLRNAVELVRCGGWIFVGDVRNLRLHAAFAAWAEAIPAELSDRRETWKAALTDRLTREPELLVAPEYFLQLKERDPSVRSVLVLLKDTAATNEMSKFRYDVIIRVGPDAPTPQVVDWIDWERVGEAELLARLDTERPCPLGVRRIPNARVRAEVDVLSELDGGTRRAGPGVDPSVLRQHAERRGYTCYPTWNVAWADGAYDAVFIRGDGFRPVEIPTGGDMLVSALTNVVAHGQRDKTRELRLRQFLAQSLPAHMRPSGFAFVDRLPVTPAGKVDRSTLVRSALPPVAPMYSSGPQDTTTLLFALWRDLLEREDIEWTDDFFELGGHSLLATQLLSRIHEAFGVQLSLRTMFDRSTFAQIHALIEAAVVPNGGVLPERTDASGSRDVDGSHGSSRR